MKREFTLAADYYNQGYKLAITLDSKLDMAQALLVWLKPIPAKELQISNTCLYQS